MTSWPVRRGLLPFEAVFETFDAAALPCIRISCELDWCPQPKRVRLASEAAQRPVEGGNEPRIPVSSLPRIVEHSE